MVIIVTGIALIFSDPHKTQYVFDTIRSKDYVSESFLTFGEYDIFAKIIGDNFNELQKNYKDILSIDGVITKHSKTLTIVKE